ncbi:MAG: 1-acyl-sn-glycerol-3-phosphate acyltransferase [Ilumatobacteraceae bacterium]
MFELLVSNRLLRRVVTLPALFAVSTLVTITAPLWITGVFVTDLLRSPRRRPLTRLGLFGWAWCLTECAGVLAAFGLWLSGRSRDHAAHYRLMAWWAGRLMRHMTHAMQIKIEVVGAESLAGGRAVVMSRHASLADSLVSAWVICTCNGLWPRYVLKRELILDPCLDVVGLRVPNHFVHRGAADSAGDLQALRALAATVDDRSIAVIFPEGTRSSPEKRRRALDAIKRRDPERAERVGGLRNLLPIRPSGALALLEGAPDADVIFAWHTGFDGLDTFGGIIRMLRYGGDECRFVMRRVQRCEVPADVAGWLDGEWARMDGEVTRVLGERQ